ncbi:MAG TPA: DUF5522 domain-containing protein [Granulicella sp.]|jgi:hypothetical protein|nr:DUF5522 domain-containing protein [Granulicella sp.]
MADRDQFAPKPDSNSPTPSPSQPPSELAPEDFYWEGPYMVFTAAYHLKRGYCCNSDCRHCPYR